MTPKQEAALRQAREALVGTQLYGYFVQHSSLPHQISVALAAIDEALAEQPHCDDCGGFDPECPLAQPAQQQEPVAWISVKDALPKAVRGVSYKQSLTDVVIVRHSDRPDYPITAHAIVGEGLGAGIAIPTDGASEHPEIAWYSASSNLNNPFDLKNDDYGRYLPKVFGSKITHWKPIDTPPQPSKPWVGLTDEEIKSCIPGNIRSPDPWLTFARAIEAAHGIKGDA